jgi:hypothetical protein
LRWSGSGEGTAWAAGSGDLPLQGVPAQDLLHGEEATVIAEDVVDDGK